MPKARITIGKRITDSTRKFVVHVTAQDTKGAVCKDHQKCVIAQAIMRKGAAWVDVGACTVLVGTSPKTGKRYRLTSEAKEQVRYFDEKNAFAPCTVRLRPFTGRNQLGGRANENRKETRRKKSFKKRRQPTR